MVAVNPADYEHIFSSYARSRDQDQTECELQFLECIAHTKPPTEHSLELDLYAAKRLVYQDE